MRSKSSSILISMLGLALLNGCSNPSRQDGTQVQVTEETKAQIQDMRDTYKDMADDRFKGQ
ncbi:hypothetical protein [Tautonia plasticadhaerens]|uniref:Uncharacterized protein n=1 Tax=Tautonia plasticadhaerens TaxID=2527974 RepID=A0A518H1W8_9BACT|nr:hypothetical protein [Tautonia plasticadhaerens]QDV34804.1 hypothetical protein ElP_27000 [Tautonia plasticadhaerens]